MSKLASPPTLSLWVPMSAMPKCDSCYRENASNSTCRQERKHTTSSFETNFEFVMAWDQSCFRHDGGLLGWNGPTSKSFVATPSPAAVPKYQLEFPDRRVSPCMDCTSRRLASTVCRDTLRHTGVIEGHCLLLKPNTGEKESPGACRRRFKVARALLEPTRPELPFLLAVSGDERSIHKLAVHAEIPKGPEPAVAKAASKPLIVLDMKKLLTKMVKKQTILSAAAFAAMTKKQAGKPCTEIVNILKKPPKPLQRSPTAATKENHGPTKQPASLPSPLDRKPAAKTHHLGTSPRKRTLLTAMKQPPLRTLTPNEEDSAGKDPEVPIEFMMSESKKRKASEKVVDLTLESSDDDDEMPLSNHRESPNVHFRPPPGKKSKSWLVIDTSDSSEDDNAEMSPQKSVAFKRVNRAESKEPTVGKTQPHSSLVGTNKETSYEMRLLNEKPATTRLSFDSGMFGGLPREGAMRSNHAAKIMMPWIRNNPGKAKTVLLSSEKDLSIEGPWGRYSTEAFYGLLNSIRIDHNGALLSISEIEETSDFTKENTIKNVSDADTRVVKMGKRTLKLQDRAQYGRTMGRLAAHLFSDIFKLDCMKNHLFIDIGSGMGSLVMQAAFCLGIRARGIEMSGFRHKTALQCYAALEARLYDENKHFRGEVLLRHGRLEDPSHRAWLTQDDPSSDSGENIKAFCNNFNEVFGARASSSAPEKLPTPNDMLAGLFCGMGKGAELVTLCALDSLPPTRSSINKKRLMNGLPYCERAGFYEVEEFENPGGKDNLSWTLREFKVWKYTRVGSDEATFLCSAKDCPHNTEPLRGSREVNHMNEIWVVPVQNCDCNKSRAPSGRRRKLINYADVLHGTSALSDEED